MDGFWVVLDGFWAVFYGFGRVFAGFERFLQCAFLAQEWGWFYQVDFQFFSPQITQIRKQNTKDGMI